jgi:hypothetical protein
MITENKNPKFTVIFETGKKNETWIIDVSKIEIVDEDGCLGKRKRKETNHYKPVVKKEGKGK